MASNGKYPSFPGLYERPRVADISLPAVQLRDSGGIKRSGGMYHSKRSKALLPGREYPSNLCCLWAW